MIDLGASDYPVMDAVSACEQYTAQSKGCDVTTLAANEQHHHQPGQVKQATSALNSCSVMLQRRFFPPWHDSDYDMDCTQMVYHQVVRSIKTGHHHYQSVCRQLWLGRTVCVCLCVCLCVCVCACVRVFVFVVSWSRYLPHSDYTILVIYSASLVSLSLEEIPL